MLGQYLAASLTTTNQLVQELRQQRQQLNVQPQNGPIGLEPVTQVQLGLPLKDIKDFKPFNSSLKNPEKREKFVSIHEWISIYLFIYFLIRTLCSRLRL